MEEAKKRSTDIQLPRMERKRRGEGTRREAGVERKESKPSKTLETSLYVHLLEEPTPTCLLLFPYPQISCCFCHSRTKRQTNQLINIMEMRGGEGREGKEVFNLIKFCES